MIRYGTVNWYDLDFILFISVAVGFSIPCFVYGRIIGTILVSVVFVITTCSWLVYRGVLRKIAFEGRESK